MGSVIAGSAFWARKTKRAEPFSRAFRSCFAPTTTLEFFSFSKSPHSGIIQSFIVSIQILIIITFFKMSTKICENFRFFQLNLRRKCRNFPIPSQNSYVFFSKTKVLSAATKASSSCNNFQPTPNCVSVKAPTNKGRVAITSTPI